MTSTVAAPPRTPARSMTRPTSSPGPAALPLARLLVPASAVVAVAARIPFLRSALAPDEAGFLLVGQQWRPGGTSLYGSYWVDRPPLLVTLFRLASELGGEVPLRLMGCLATAIVVLGCAHVARTIAGHRAAAWAAGLAGAATVAALLVKQNMADVGVFAAVVRLVGWRRGEVSGRRLRTAT